jgi:hypothetical protein
MNMRFGDHIELGDWNGQCLLTVRDAELHDFLEDFFTARGIESQVVLPPGQYQLLFPRAVSKATIHRLLDQVGVGEIDRIVGINARAPGVPGGQ